MQSYSPIVLLGRNWLTARSDHTLVSIAKVHLLIPPYIMTALKELSGSIISTGKLVRHPQTIDRCQYANPLVHHRTLRKKATVLRYNKGAVVW